MNNSTQVLTRELLIKTYYLLTSNILSSEVVESLLEEYYMHIDEPTMQLTSHMHCLILNK